MCVLVSWVVGPVGLLRCYLFLFCCRRTGVVREEYGGGISDETVASFFVACVFHFFDEKLLTIVRQIFGGGGARALIPNVDVNHDARDWVSSIESGLTYWRGTLRSTGWFASLLQQYTPCFSWRKVPAVAVENFDACGG